MKRRTVFLVLALPLLLLLPLKSVFAKSASPCVTTARLMHQACRSDLWDDYRTTLANCNNLSVKGDRNSCIQDAKVSLIDGRGECVDQSTSRRKVCDLLDEDRYDPDPLLDPAITFVEPDDIGIDYDPNPYFSLVTGHTYVLQAGEDGEETVVVYVTDQTLEIQGVNCRVVVDTALTLEEDGDETEYIPEEVTDDWYAQDNEGNVYYCGELSRNFEDSRLTDLDGSFEAGKEFAKSGVLIRAEPTIGHADRQEFSLGEAEDIVKYADLMASPTEENTTYPCDGGCLKTFDFSPLEPASSELKYYLPNIGFVLAEAMEDGELTGEREELVCVGDSLEILKDVACGFEDPDALLDKLCELSPTVFCGDD